MMDMRKRWKIVYFVILFSLCTSTLAFHITPMQRRYLMPSFHGVMVPSSSLPILQPRVDFVLHSHDENSFETQFSSGGRAGGRNKKQLSPPQLTIPNIWEKVPNIMKNVIFPVALVLALLKFLLGILFSPLSSSVVYYQSTVYETRSYYENNKVKTERKESIKSNAPELIRSSRSTSSIGDESLLDSRFMRVLDRDLDREFTQMERFMKDVF